MQTKLAVGASGGAYEEEADRVAEQVLATPQRADAAGVPAQIHRFSTCATGPIKETPSSVERVLFGAGQPLETSLRADMERRFGYDLSRVRVHLGPAAERSARDINAHAYTAGHNIVFGAGQYSPASSSGRRLLAHELTHTLQQTGFDTVAKKSGAPRASAGPSPTLVQRREMGSGLDDPLYMADRRWSAGQGPDDRVTGQRLQNWAIARGSFVVRSDITLMRMQEQDGIESQIVDEIYWLLISLLRGEGPYDVENVVFAGEKPSYAGLIGESTRLDKFEGSANAREMAVLELADHWGPIERYLTGALQTRYRDSYLEAAGRTPENMSLEDDPDTISRIRHNPYRHYHTIDQGFVGEINFLVGKRYGPFWIADIYKTFGSGSTGGGTVWVYRDGFPLWYYSGSVDLLDRQAVIGEVARSSAESAKFAAMLLPLAIKIAGFALSFSPNPFFMIAGVVLEELGEEGLRDLNGQGRKFKDIASEAAREILINLVLGHLFGGGEGEGVGASQAAEALDKVAEKAAIKIRTAVEEEIVRTEGPEIANAVEAGEAQAVPDGPLRREGFEYEVEIKQDGNSHIYRRKGDGEWCRWSRRLCGIKGIEEEVDVAAIKEGEASGEEATEAGLEAPEKTPAPAEGETAARAEGEAAGRAAAPDPAPFDMKKIGADAEPRQLLKSGEFSSVKLKPDQDALYILRDADGTVLKVGKTSASAAKNRFSVYSRAGDMTGKKLTLEVYPLKSTGRNAEYYESALRKEMENEGHAMPWDNTRGRLGRPGFGTPGEGLRKSPVTKGEMSDLLKAHKGNLREVGKELGVHRRTVDLWAKSLGLNPKDFR